MTTTNALLILQSGSATREVLFEIMAGKARLLEESEWDGPVLTPVESAVLYRGSTTRLPLLAISGSDYLRLQEVPGAVDAFVFDAAQAQSHEARIRVLDVALLAAAAPSVGSFDRRI